MPVENFDVPSASQQPNWVDKLMLCVNAVGVLAVAFYGWQAWVANGLTRKSY
jgi:hypothetical protein